MKKRRVAFTVLILAMMLLVSTYSGSVLAFKDVEPPQPTYIEPGDSLPIVDGEISEWDLQRDFFTEMYEAGNPDKDPLSNLYLQYDCQSGTLYILVLALEDLIVHKWPEDAHLKRLNPNPPPPWQVLVDGNSGNDGSAPDFAWVELDPPGTDTALGWEGSALVDRGTYINLHVQVIEDRTSAVISRSTELVIQCEPTAITLVSFSAEAGAEGVALAWETGTELDNAGFNLYRATAEDGPYTKINEALFAAEGDAVAGASYSFLDTPGYGTFYYKLGDVDYYGMSTLHGPVEATVARPLRRPLYRPLPPLFALILVGMGASGFVMIQCKKRRA
jgi:hypothetical protein